MMLSSRFQLAIAVVAMTAAANALAAQDPPLRTISKLDLEYAEPFSCISGLRELSNGRVIVGDAREKTLQLIDLRSGAVTKIGREGQGPAEWGSPAGLFAGVGDTTLLWDQANRRFLVIHPDGTPGRTFMTSAESGSGITIFTPPRGVDRLGRIYMPGSDFARGPDGAPTAADSAAILRFDPRSGRTDTLGFVRNPKADIQTQSAGRRNMIMIMAPNPMLPQTTWTVAPDGRVAIVRPEPYQVEWLGANRAKSAGPVIRYQRLPVTQADKEAVPPINNCATTITIGGPGRGGGGGAVPSSGRGTERRVAPRDDWPEYKPPFLAGGRGVGNVVAAPNGDVWVLRARPAGDEVPTYDIFDARGQLTGRIALPKKTTFVGFGNGTIYLSRMDEDDLLYLQRYRLDAVR